MKRKMILIALLAVLAVFMTSAYIFHSTSSNRDKVLTASKELAKISKALPMFNMVKLTGICNVEIKYDQNCKIEVRGPKNFVENLSYSVSNCTLNIKMNKEYAYRTAEKNNGFLSIVIYLPVLTKIEKDNLGDVKVADDVQFENLYAINSSMSDLTFGEIDCNTAILLLKSGGNLYTGNIKVRTALTCRNTSMGTMKIENVTADKFQMELSSGGDLTVGDVMVKKELKCNNTSMGELKMGNVTCLNLEMNLLSSGNIEVNDIICQENVICENSSMGKIKVNTIDCKNACDVNLSSGGSFIAYRVIANKLNCTSSSIGKIKIKKTDVKSYSQKADNGNISINY